MDNVLSLQMLGTTLIKPGIETCESKLSCNSQASCFSANSDNGLQAGNFGGNNLSW